MMRPSGRKSPLVSNDPAPTGGTLVLRHATPVLRERIARRHLGNNTHGRNRGHDNNNSELHNDTTPCSSRFAQDGSRTLRSPRLGSSMAGTWAPSGAEGTTSPAPQNARATSTHSLAGLPAWGPAGRPSRHLPSMGLGDSGCNLLPEVTREFVPFTAARPRWNLTTLPSCPASRDLSRQTGRQGPNERTHAPLPMSSTCRSP